MWGEPAAAEARVTLQQPEACGVFSRGSCPWITGPWQWRAALIIRAGISPLCPPHPCGCALLRGSEASPLCHPPSPPGKGLPSVWKPFLLHSSLPLVQVSSLSFCLCYFFFLLPYPGTWGVSCLLGGLRSSASVQWVFYRSCSTCRCISDVSVGRKVIYPSYSSAIFSSLQACLSYLPL